MEGRIFEELLFKIMAIYLIAGIIVAWIGWKLIRWSVMKIYFLWRSSRTGTVLLDPDGPVEEVRWGFFRISGKEMQKDVRCIGRVPTPWTDRKGHMLTEEMITGIFDANIEVLVIGLGIDGAVRCPQKLIEYIRERGIQEVIALPTGEAGQKFNELVRAGKNTALLAHGTC